MITLSISNLIEKASSKSINDVITPGKTGIITLLKDIKKSFTNKDGKKEDFIIIKSVFTDSDGNKTPIVLTEAIIANLTIRDNGKDTPMSEFLATAKDVSKVNFSSFNVLEAKATDYYLLRDYKNYDTEYDSTRDALSKANPDTAITKQMIMDKLDRDAVKAGGPKDGVNPISNLFIAPFELDTE